MTAKNTGGDDPDKLRRQAEEKARAQNARKGITAEALSSEETQRTLHELRVHKIELEMQNDELRRAQAELDAVVVRYFDLYDLAPVGYCTLSQEGLILEANLTAASLLGVSRGVLVNKLLTRFIFQEDQDIYYLHRKQLIETGAPQSCELRMVKNGGTPFWSHIASMVVQNTGGAPLIRSVMSDISTRKESEETIQRIRYQNELILNAAGEGIFGLDLQGKSTFINPAAAKMLGYGVEELIGKGSHGLIHHTKMDGNPYPEEECPIYASFRKGDVFHIEEDIFWKKNGTGFPVEYSCTPIVEKGELAGAVVTFLDITRRKVAETRRREEAGRLRERIKELNCLFSISELFRKPELVQAEIFQGIVDRIPSAWLHPKIACARLVIKNREFQTGNFRQTPWKATADILVNGQSEGFLEVGYLEEPGWGSEGPFLPEETALIEEIAERTARFIERVEAQKALIRERDQAKTLLDLYRLPGSSIQDFSGFLVAECVKVSESQLGFFGFINEEETLMSAHLWSEKAMETCAMDNRPVAFSLGHAGIWAEAIREHRPVIVNDYQKPDPRKKGYPEGHVPIARLLSIPIVEGGRAVAIVAVANKEQEYGESDILHLNLLIRSVWGIVQRKRAEEALREGEAKFRVLFEQAAVGVAQIETATGRFMRINQRYGDIVGYSPEEMLSRTFQEITCPEDLNEDLRNMEDLIAGKIREFSMEKRYRHKNGSLIWVNLTVSPMWAAGELPDYHIAVVQDITKRKQTEERVRILSQQLLRSQEEERRRISRELHDDIGQNLSALKIGMEGPWTNQLERLPEVRQKFRECSQILRETIQGVRDMAHNLRPSSIDQLGLVKAAQQYCEEFSAKHRIQVDFIAAGIDEAFLDYDTRIALYRLIQEGLININKHAAATLAVIRLVSSFPSIIVRIEDNGQGFDVIKRQTGAVEEKRLGLSSMEERVFLLQGRMKIDSLPGQGTRIFIEIPSHISTGKEPNGREEKNPAR